MGFKISDTKEKEVLSSLSTHKDDLTLPRRSPPSPSIVGDIIFNPSVIRVYDRFGRLSTHSNHINPGLCRLYYCIRPVTGTDRNQTYLTPRPFRCVNLSLINFVTSTK